MGNYAEINGDVILENNSESREKIFEVLDSDLILDNRSSVKVKDGNLVLNIDMSGNLYKNVKELIKSLEPHIVKPSKIKLNDEYGSDPIRLVPDSNVETEEEIGKQAVDTVLGRLDVISDNRLEMLRNKIEKFLYG